MAERGQFEVRWMPGMLANGPLGPPAAALIAALFPEALQALLDKQIDEVPAAGLPEAARPKRDEQPGRFTLHGAARRHEPP